MTTLLRSSSILALTSALALAACRSKDDRAGMPGMSGTMSGMMSMAMADSMRAHLRGMGGMSADRMKAMAVMHRQMVANMLSQMSTEMRQMNKTFMPAHTGRVTRLIQMHQRMMGGMNM